MARFGHAARIRGMSEQVCCPAWRTGARFGIGVLSVVVACSGAENAPPSANSKDDTEGAAAAAGVEGCGGHDAGTGGGAGSASAGAAGSSAGSAGGSAGAGAGAPREAGSGGATAGNRSFVMGAENKNGTHEEFEAAVQCDVNIQQTTTGWCDTWDNWESDGCDVLGEVSAFYHADPRHAVELSLTPWPHWPEPRDDYSWAACAEGAYDEHYARLAESLQAANLNHVLIRLGYEWDGNWFAWGTGLHETGDVNHRGNGGTALEYAACFRRFDAVVQEVASRSRQRVFWRMVMNPIHDTAGTKAAQLQQVFDAAGGAVDVLGIDLYDYPARNNLDQRLQGAIEFAKSNQVPLAFPEWGVGGDSRAQPATDDAGVRYLERMHAAFADPTNGVRYASYFNCATSDCAGNHALIPPHNPRSNATFTELFSDTSLGCGADARAMVEGL